MLPWNRTKPTRFAAKFTTHVRELLEIKAGENTVNFVMCVVDITKSVANIARGVIMV